MAITLVTGQPGHGKSLYAIWRGLQFVKEGRPVYVSGFKDIDYEATGFKPLPHRFDEYDSEDRDDQGRQMPKWQLLPHGSVIMLDECYDMLPTRAAGRAVPAHIDALARHRHHGYDIVLVCQMHNQIDSFVKGLVDPHIHVRRKFGFPVAVLKTWDRFKSDTSATDTSAAPTWRYPKDVYRYYTSATMHTVKKKLPWFIWIIPVAAAGLVLCLWFTFHRFKKMGDGSDAAKAAGPATSAVAAAHAQQAKDDSLRITNYPKWIQPRVPGQPWTAPAFDSQQVAAQPKIFCVAVDDGRCHCYTEQATKYEVPVSLCRRIVADGVYNPFAKPLDEGRAKPSDAQQGQQEASVVRSGVSGQVADVSDSQSYAKGTIPQSYTPPEAMRHESPSTMGRGVNAGNN